MQTLLFNQPTVNLEDLLWQRAAKRECVQYGEHGEQVVLDEGQRVTCFNCGGSL